MLGMHSLAVQSLSSFVRQIVMLVCGLQFVKQMLPKPPQDKKKDRYIVPSGICPEMCRTRIEVLAWGVRDMKRYQLLSVDNPSVQLEVGGHIVKSEPINNLKKNPNFENPHLVFKPMVSSLTLCIMARIGVM